MKLFSCKKDENNSHRIIEILGLKIKLRKECFPAKAKSFTKILTPLKGNNAAIFAMYNGYSKIDDNLLLYFKEIKKYVKYLIVVGDMPVLEPELDKLDGLVDAYIFKRHKEYDFGSYKRGFLLLKKMKNFSELKQLFLLNDSVSYTGADLKNLFEKAYGKKFYALTYHAYGYTKNKENAEYGWGYIPHLQSFWLAISAAIFKDKRFEKFMKNVKKEKK